MWNLRIWRVNYMYFQISSYQIPQISAFWKAFDIDGDLLILWWQWRQLRRGTALPKKITGETPFPLLDFPSRERTLDENLLVDEQSTQFDCHCHPPQLPKNVQEPHPHPETSPI